MAFLKIGIGGRAIGLGGAYTAVAEDATAAYWNPAGLAFLRRSELSFTHNRWIQDVKSEFVGMAFPKGKSSIGLSFISTNVDGIERRTKPTVKPIGIIQAHDIAAAISYSRKLSENLSWGITFKYLYEKIYIESAWGLAVDFGLLYRAEIRGLKFGLSGQNLGKTTKFKEKPITLPRIFRIGLAYSPPQEIFDGRFLLTTDFVHLLDSNSHVNMGVEFNFQEKLSFRMGYQTNYEEKGLTWGIGLGMSRFQLDWGYMPFSSGLGNTHRISVKVKI